MLLGTFTINRNKNKPGANQVKNNASKDGGPEQYFGAI